MRTWSDIYDFSVFIDCGSRFGSSFHVCSCVLQTFSCTNCSSLFGQILMKFRIVDFVKIRSGPEATGRVGISKGTGHSPFALDGSCFLFFFRIVT